MPAFPRIAPVLLLAAACIAAPALGDGPTLLGVAKSWSAYQTSTGDGRVCYALSKPKAVEPKKAARDPIFLIVSDWPGRKAQDEVEVVPGYQYKDGEPVIAQVGSEKVEFFTRNDGGAGSAWIKEPGDETRLVAAMRHGSTITVSGVSQRGTRTRDTYSLAGIGAMLDRIRDACSK